LVQGKHVLHPSPANPRRVSLSIARLEIAECSALDFQSCPGLLTQGSLQVKTLAFLVSRSGSHPDRSAWGLFVATENLWRVVEGSRGSFPGHAAAGSCFRELSLLPSHVEKRRHL